VKHLQQTIDAKIGELGNQQKAGNEERIPELIGKLVVRQSPDCLGDRN